MAQSRHWNFRSEPWPGFCPTMLAPPARNTTVITLSIEARSSPRSGLAYPDGSLMSNPITATAAVRDQTESARLRPKLMSFDVFGTLISVRESSYGAFERILLDAGAPHL